jgi:ribose 5-phosphate isomerase B
MPIRLAIGADHGGFALKNELVERLKDEYSVADIGAATLNPQDDYPEIALAMAKVVVSGQAKRRILICGSGVGACIAANKVPGARACLCHDTYSAHQGVEHDDMNILCLGARVIGVELAIDLVQAFLKASFCGGGKYLRRVEQIRLIEEDVRGGRILGNLQ